MLGRDVALDFRFVRLIWCISRYVLNDHADVGDRHSLYQRQVISYARKKSKINEECD